MSINVAKYCSSEMLTSGWCLIGFMPDKGGNVLIRSSAPSEAIINGENWTRSFAVQLNGVWAGLTPDKDPHCRVEMVQVAK